MAQKITSEDVHKAIGTESPVELMTAIYNSSTSMFRNLVPLPNEDNVREVGAGILKLTANQNEFIENIINRIGKVIIKYKSSYNPLKSFKKGEMALSETIEEIWVDIASEKLFDPEASVTSVFSREIPDVKALFHKKNREGFYKQTIQQAQLEKAFTSWEKFDSFIAGVMNALYGGDEIDEFRYMKLLIENYNDKRLFKEVVVGEVTDANVRSFVQKVKAVSGMLEFPSRDYNAQGVMQSTSKSDQYFITDVANDAKIDTEVLASAFNMNKVEFTGHKVIIDHLPEGVVGILVDADWYMVYDSLYRMTNLFNPEGLYWNYWLHHHQVLSVSQFSNAVIFVEETQEPLPEPLPEP